MGNPVIKMIKDYRKTLTVKIVIIFFGNNLFVKDLYDFFNLERVNLS